MNKIANALQQHFEKHRIGFWYETQREMRAFSMQSGCRVIGGRKSGAGATWVRLYRDAGISGQQGTPSLSWVSSGRRQAPW